ncbi:MAG: hypothetical protein QXO86_00760 [Nitrososphaerota archaeon]
MKALATTLLATLLMVSVLPLSISLEEANLGAGFNLEEAVLGKGLKLEFPSTRLVSGMLTGRLGLVARGEDPLLRLGEEGEKPGERRIEDIGRGEGAPPSKLQAPGAAGILVPFRSPAPAFSRNIIITRDFSNAPIQTEPHIAVNPNNPDHIVVGVIDYNFAGVSAYVSLDGGQTWTGPRQLRYLRDDAGSGGDPVVDFDREGNVYFTSISIGVEEFRIGAIVSEEVVSSIIVSRSSDGGFTWSEPISVARSGITFRDVRFDERGRIRGSIVFTFLDKPWLDVGPDRNNPQKDAVYVSFTEFAVVWDILYIEDLVFLGNPRIESVIKLVKSSTDFSVMTVPIQVSPVVVRGYGGETGQKRVVQGSQPAVAPDGTVYVAWLDTLDDDSAKGLGEIHVAKSTDGGRTWSRPLRAMVFNEVSFLPRNAAFRNWGSSFPQIAIGPQGEVYIVAVGRPADKQLDDGDVFFVRSLDGGVTWSQPKRLNDDETSRLQFFPAIAVDPNGIIHVMWGDMRDDPVETKYHIYYTKSDDRGETWGFEIPELAQRFGSTRVSDSYSNPNFGFPRGAFIGDYFAIKATSSDVYMVWADCRLGEFAGLNQKIAFVRRRAITAPSIFVSPPSGVAGRDVTVVGSNFQPDTNIYIELSGSVIAYTKTDEEGAFTARIFTPLTSQGSHTIVAYDQTGNYAVASFYIEFGFNNLAETLSAIQQQEGRFDSLSAQIQELRSLIAARNGSDGQGGDRQSPGSADILLILVVALIGVAVGLAAGIAISRARRPKQK